MSTEPSSHTTEPLPPEKRHLLSRRVIISMAIWLFCWPLLMYVSACLITLPNPSYLIILIAGSMVWIVSLACLYHIFFTMVERRWPVVTPIRKFVELVFAMLRLLRPS